MPGSNAIGNGSDFARCHTKSSTATFADITGTFGDRYISRGVPSRRDKSIFPVQEGYDVLQVPVTFYNVRLRVFMYGSCMDVHAII